MADGALSAVPAAASPLSTANVHPDGVGTLTRSPLSWHEALEAQDGFRAPFFVQLYVLMQAGGSDHTLSCDVVALPTPLLSRLSSHVWPKSPFDRALSCTDLGVGCALAPSHSLRAPWPA